MSQKYSTNSFITYIKNEKLYRTPKTNVDSLLISWGVISGHFQSDGTFKTTKLYHNYQIFVMVFIWCLAIRYAFSIFFNETNTYIPFLETCLLHSIQ